MKNHHEFANKVFDLFISLFEVIKLLVRDVKFKKVNHEGLLLIAIIIFCMLLSARVLFYVPALSNIKVLWLLLFSLLSPYFIWGVRRFNKLNEFKKDLQEGLVTCNLKNPLGKMPQFIELFDIDQETQKLILSKLSFSYQDFVNQKLRLESGLRCYIDDIKENRTKGTIEFILSKNSLPSSVNSNFEVSVKPFQFFVGETRSKEIVGSLNETPHLLIAGQTGGGKSTFLRNLITSFYLNSKNMKFTLIDLKGGLEFQIFEGLKNIAVIPSVESAILGLNEIQKELHKRMSYLKSKKIKDIVEIEKDTKEYKFFNHRHLVVVDEIAEMFLGSFNSDNKKLIEARRILSLIARQGRAVGIHLVVATQRPDSKSLDPQIKANLVGVLCFPMQNDSSSITVLGNGRATDLPLIPGRAIWKNGALMTEIQTPHLSVNKAEEILDGLKEKKEE